MARRATSSSFSMCVAIRASARALPSSASSTRPILGRVFAHWSVIANKRDGFVQACSRPKNRGDAQVTNFVDVILRNRSTGHHENIVEAILMERIHDAGKQREMGAREDAQPDYVDILLQCS